MISHIMITSDKQTKRWIYTHKGIAYEILDERAEQILKDFLHCEKIGDWKTIKNRMINGTMWGWLKEVESKEEFWKQKEK
jgi:hypothetical protein